MNYKFISKLQVKRIKKIEKSFEFLVKKTNNSNFFFWYHNISRLDFVPLAGLNCKDFLILKKNNLLFIKNFLKDLIKIFKFSLLSSTKKKNKFKKIILIYESVLLNNIKAKNFYFKKIFNKNDCSEIVLTASRIEDRNQFPIYNFINFADCLKCFFLTLKSFFYLYFLINSVFKSNKVMRDFWIKLYFMKESFFGTFQCYIVQKALLRLPDTKRKIIFPYEEKTFERAIAKTKLKLKNTELYAYVINPRHKLASYDKNWKNLNIPRANKYFFCGRYYNSVFNKLGRFNDINYKMNVLGSNKSKLVNLNIKKNNKFLFLLSHENEFMNFINYILSNKFLLNYKYIVRDYPNNPVKNLKKIICKFNLNKNIFLSKKNNSIIDDCKNVRGVIFSATSAGIECINYGRIGIWSNFSEIGMNPMFDKVKNYFPSINHLDLQKNLNFISNLNKRKYKKILNIQRKFNKNIYSEINKKNILAIYNN